MNEKCYKFQEQKSLRCIENKFMLEEHIKQSQHIKLRMILQASKLQNSYSIYYKDIPHTKQ
jgi:hypothetical protein